MSEHQHFWGGLGTQTVFIEERWCPCGARERRASDGSWQPVAPGVEEQLAWVREENRQMRKLLETVRRLHIHSISPATAYTVADFLDHHKEQSDG